MSQAAAAIPDGKLIMYFCKFAMLFGHKARQSPRRRSGDARGMLINPGAAKGSRPVPLIQKKNKQQTIRSHRSRIHTGIYRARVGLCIHNIGVFL